jgi:dTDP-4-amino-4,6-dideoxygalactose transaminase
MIRFTQPALPPLEEYTEYLQQIWKSKWVTNGASLTRAFERKLEERLQVKHVVTVANGTLGLQLALHALCKNKEVIHSPFTFAATTNAIVWQGKTPVFADIDRRSLCLSTRACEEAFTEHTGAIFPTHVYGNPASPEEFEKLSRKKRVPLLFDAAHAFGVRYRDRSIASFGDATIFSFHATKVFHTIEGGAIATNNAELATYLRLLRNHGIKSEQVIAVCGTNAKLNELQAAMGLCNLEHFTSSQSKRQASYEVYERSFSQSLVELPERTASLYNFAYYPIILPSESVREGLYYHLRDQGIEGRRYFWPLTHEIPELAGFVSCTQLSNARDLSGRILCLPLSSTLLPENAMRIARTTLKWLKGCSKHDSSNDKLQLP